MRRISLAAAAGLGHLAHGVVSSSPQPSCPRLAPYLYPAAAYGMDKPRPLRPAWFPSRVCVPWPAPPRLLPLCCACVCVPPSPVACVKPQPVCASLARATPTPFAINATCPRYLAVRSELEHCEPLPLRVPLARSRPHSRPSAIRLVIALLTKTLQGVAP